eukprot:SAG31_NODE_27520_length_424_cov_3.387692_1_plen_63_part_10
MEPYYKHSICFCFSCCVAARPNGGRRQEANSERHLGWSQWRWRAGSGRIASGSMPAADQKATR